MKKKIFEKEWRALGTDIYAQIVSDSEHGLEMDEIFGKIEDIYSAKEKIFSRFDEQSELSKINSNLSRFMTASPDMLYLAKKAKSYFQESEGIFDPRILEILESSGYAKSFSENNFSSGFSEKEKKWLENNLDEELLIQESQIKFLRRMDFSGIAKGYITDQVAEFLRSSGFRNFLVDSGGDMMACGKNSLNDAWGISLEGAVNENEIVVEISDEAVATSGATRRKWERRGKQFHHLVDPRSPEKFDFELKSVTVVEKTVERADVWAKILFILGLEKGMELADEKNMKAIFLKNNGDMLKSKYV